MTKVNPKVTRKSEEKSTFHQNLHQHLRSIDAAVDPSTHSQIEAVISYENTSQHLLESEIATIDALYSTILQRFPKLKGKDFMVKYKDDEEDWITIVTKCDLQQALELMQNDEKSKKQYLSLSSSPLSKLHLIITLAKLPSPPELSLTDSDSDSSFSIPSIQRSVSKRDESTVSEVLCNAINEIPKPVYKQCKIARLFRYMVKALVCSSERTGKIDAASVSVSRSLKESGRLKSSKKDSEKSLMRVTKPSQRCDTVPSSKIDDLKTSISSHQKELKGTINQKRIPSAQEISECQAMEWLRSMGFRDEALIRRALVAENGNAQRAVDRLLDTKQAI
mmetsp:Transcript_33449/g.46685  ORF Transcript_33449/g.46685 Transcript_33449/m.46685 type:complete len:335 (+) Transcript_33449:315-1319(+)|eukprot:CAMPEP_0185252884 /NCGR_PEP_ID=MMETSP1359-20130426/1837_1 /TAXON_ID=552665 /ORGANISM="Bigelowiella longifila, Strain CCMP242" /LENGTH=334 /DNA_ID=CAMNT_0027835151 /DNA_START=211 /DNA_END=1215 /DNA_ORIENTATION=-